MANLQLTVPDDLVPRIVDALKSRFPDLTGTNAQVAKEGIKRLLAEALAAAESRAAETTGYEDMIAAAGAARSKAAEDAAAIT